jgi:hypothetical protein
MMRRRIVGPVVCLGLSVIPVLMVAAGGVVIASTPVDVDSEARIETRVLDSGFEPVPGSEKQRIFVVCTIRARVMTCKTFDLSAAASASN